MQDTAEWWSQYEDVDAYEPPADVWDQAVAGAFDSLAEVDPALYEPIDVEDPLFVEPAEALTDIDSSDDHSDDRSDDQLTLDDGLHSHDLHISDPHIKLHDADDADDEVDGDDF